MDVKQLQEQFTNLKSRKSDFLGELQNLKNKQYDLSILVNDENRSAEEMANTIDSLQKTLYDINELLQKHEEELNNVSNKIKSTENQLSKIEQLILEKENQLRKLQNDALCRKSLTINSENTFYASIKKNSITTPIITQYCKSNKEFMKLNAGMKLSDGANFSYIIVRSNTKITSRQDKVPTMSELKSVAGKYLISVHIPRMEFLKEHILAVTKNNKNSLPNTIIPLSEPCLIGGQSDFDQMGYGWEWTWEYGIGDYIEGTYYGEMSGFSVIGICINKPEYY